VLDPALERLGGGPLSQAEPAEVAERLDLDLDDSPEVAADVARLTHHQLDRFRSLGARETVEALGRDLERPDVVRRVHRGLRRHVGKAQRPPQAVG
jgi:hypothetical protein